MRSLDLFHTALLSTLTNVSAAPATTIPYPPSLTLTTNTTTPLTIWPNLPWSTKLRTSDPEPPAFLDIFSVDAHPTTPQRAYELQEFVLLPLALWISSLEGPATETEIASVGGREAIGAMGARFVPVQGEEVSRVVAATAVAALALAERDFGARGVSGGIRVGEVRVAGVEVWVRGRGE